MSYNFMKRIERFYDDPLGWYDTILDFDNGYGLVISSSANSFPLSRLDLKKLEDYEAFEVGVVVKNDMGKFSPLSLDDCYGRINNNRLNEIIENYSGLRDLSCVPVAVVQEIADIIEKGNFLNNYEFMDKIQRSWTYLVGWINDPITFDNGYSMDIQASVNSHSEPKQDMKDINKYNSFEVFISKIDGKETERGVSWISHQRIDFSKEEIKNNRLKELVERFQGDYALNYVPAKEVQEIYDIVKSGDFI